MTGSIWARTKMKMANGSRSGAIPSANWERPLVGTRTANHQRVLMSRQPHPKASLRAENPRTTSRRISEFADTCGGLVPGSPEADTLIGRPDFVDFGPTSDRCCGSVRRNPRGYSGVLSLSFIPPARWQYEGRDKEDSRPHRMHWSMNCRGSLATTTPARSRCGTSRATRRSSR